MISAEAWEARSIARAKPHWERIETARRAFGWLDDETLEAIAEAAIGLLDERRDHDEDQCSAGDDGCGLFSAGPRSGTWWGSSYEGHSDLTTSPEFGEDQRKVLRGIGGVFRVDG